MKRLKTILAVLLLVMLTACAAKPPPTPENVLALAYGAPEAVFEDAFGLSLQKDFGQSAELSALLEMRSTVAVDGKAAVLLVEFPDGALKNVWYTVKLSDTQDDFDWILGQYAAMQKELGASYYEAYYGDTSPDMRLSAAETLPAARAFFEAYPEETLHDVFYDEARDCVAEITLKPAESGYTTRLRYHEMPERMK